MTAIKNTGVSVQTNTVLNVKCMSVKTTAILNVKCMSVQTNIILNVKFMSVNTTAILSFIGMMVQNVTKFNMSRNHYFQFYMYEYTNKAFEQE